MRRRLRRWRLLALGSYCVWLYALVFWVLSYGAGGVAVPLFALLAAASALVYLRPPAGAGRLGRRR